MENTIIIAIVSFLCILAHVPTLILRIVPFHEKISDKDRIRLTVIYAIGLAVDFGICMWVGNYREIDVPFYKINLIAFCIVMAAVNIWLVPVKNHEPPHISSSPTFFNMRMPTKFLLFTKSL